MKPRRHALIAVFYLVLAISGIAVAGIQKGSGGGTAAEIIASNSVGGWTATTVQGILEELQGNIDAVVLSATGIDDEAYNATDWDGDTTLAPSKNAVRDKVVALEAALVNPAAHVFTDQAEDSLSAEVVVSANGKSLITAANYAAMRTLLSLVVGTNVQAYDADLTTYAGITPSANIQTLLTSADYSVARSNLGLTIGTNVQAYDADLTTYAGITPSANVQAFLGAANYGAMRTQLGLVIGTNVQAYDADLDTYSGITPSANVQTMLGSANNAAILSNIGAQPVDSDLTTLAAISGSRGDILYFSATGWKNLAKGTENYVLTQGANDPAWAEATGGGASAIDDLSDVTITTGEKGDVLYFDGSAWVNVVHGTDGQFLKTGGHGASVSWGTPEGGGDMLAASYPDLVAIEALTPTNTNMMVGNGTAWVSTTPADVRTNLALVIGTNVQAYDADLTTYAGISPSANIQALLGSADYATARSNLGLAIGTNVQAYDADLTTWAGVTPSANGQSLVAANDYSAMRTLLSLVPGTNVQAYDADLATLAAPTASRMYWSNGSSAQTAISLGSSGHILYNNSGTPTFGAITTAMLPTITPAIGGTGVVNGANNTITFTGNYTLGLTLSNNTSLTLPTSGTLATLAGSEALTNKSVNGITLAGGTYTLTVPATGTAVLTSNTLASLAATTSAQLAGVLSDETGTGGGVVLATSPTLVTPTLGAATITSLVQSGQTIGSNIIATSGFSVSATGMVTVAGLSITKATGQAGQNLLYNDYLTQTTGAGWQGPTGTMANSYFLALPNAEPTANQVLKCGSPSSHISTMSWDTPLWATGGTLSGKLTLVASATGAASMNIPSGTAPSSPAGGDLYYDGTHLYFYTTSAIDLLAGGGATLSNISNPGASKSFTMAAYTLAFTSSTTTWGGVTISNTAADPAGGGLLTLGYTADGDAQTVFLDCLDNSSGDSKFKVGQHGGVTMPDAGAYIALGADPADAGAIRLSNAQYIYAEAAPAGTDISVLGVDSGEIIQLGASGASGVTITPATTITGAVTFTGGIASIGAASNLSGGIVTLGTLGGTIVVPTGATLAASGSGAITATALAASTTLTTPNIGAATGTSLALGADPADAGALRLSNATAIAWEDATEASITHVDNTGWLINAAHVFQFRDSAISVGSADDGHLDLTADTSIDLNGAVVLSSTLDVSGGAITLQNDETIGNGDDTEISFNGTEALALDLDTGTANQVRWQNRTTSTTGVTEMNFSALNLATTGTISGKVPIVTIGSGRSITSAEAQGSFIMVTAAGTYTLPAAATAGYGSTVCIYVRDASETVVIEVDNADKIRLYATALDAGDTIDSPGAAGNFVCLMAVTDTDGSGTDGWITLGTSGTWTDGGAT